jgi:hypothetical protein
MKTLEEKIRELFATMEVNDILLYTAMKKRMGDPAQFVIDTVAEFYDASSPGSEETVDCAITVAIQLFKQMVAGNVYKK